MATVILKKTFPNGNQLEVHCGAGSPKEVFKTIANIQEMLSVEKCGLCSSTNLLFGVRNAKNKQGIKCEYYEMRCVDCNAQLNFSQHQETPTLYKRTSTKEGGPMPNDGWYIWQGGGGHDDGNYTSPGYQQPQQGGYQQPPQQQYPQQGGHPPQQGGWGGQQRQQPPQQLNPPPPQSGEIPF